MLPRLPASERVVLGADDVSALLPFAIECVRAAGAEALRHFRTGIAADDKGGETFYNPVTEADRLAETAIRTRVAMQFPDHGLYGEEHGYEQGRSPLTWVIDPIDGTQAFITGMLHWGVLLALYDGVRPVLGLMYQPFTDELFVGTPGSARYQRGALTVPLKVRACAALSEAALATTGLDYFSDAARMRFLRVKAGARLTRFGGDCYIHALVAMGQLDLVVEWGLKPYDIQALMPIVQAAGGVITDWQGGDCSHGGAVICAGDARVHAEVMALLAG